MSGPFVTTTDARNGGVGGVDSGNISLRDFQQQENGTRVSAKAGYEFAPSNKDLPRITPQGVFMTAKQAEEVVAEAPEGLITTIKASELEEVDDDVDPDPFDDNNDGTENV